MAGESPAPKKLIPKQCHVSALEVSFNPHLYFSNSQAGKSVPLCRDMQCSQGAYPWRFGVNKILHHIIKFFIVKKHRTWKAVESSY